MSQLAARLPKLGSSEAPQGLDGRRHPRHELALEVSLYSDSNFYGGLTENLSAGGVFVATHSPRPIGEELEVVVTLPSNFTVKAKGVVRWQRPFVETSNMPPGMGIQFLEVEGQAEIEKFLRRRDPLYYDD